MRKCTAILYVTVTVIVVPLLLASCTKREGPEKEEREQHEEHGARAETTDRVDISPSALESMKLTYAKAEVRELSPSVAVPAELMPIPDRHATIGSRVSGRIVAVHVNVGDKIEAGASLVTLESDEVGRARAELIAAVARVEVARRAAERQRNLAKDQITSERAVEEARGALQVAEADVQALRVRLSTFGVSASVDLGKNPAEILLTSPIAGTVISRSVHIGQWVEPSLTLIEVVDLDQLWLLANVYEREMRYVEVGQPVQVEVRAFPGDVFAGHVDQVDATLDEKTRSARIRVVLPNPDHRLRPGMFATARIQGMHTHEPKRLLAVPWAAIQEVDGHHALFARIAENTFELRRVHTGERAGDLVEILNGVTDGDEVVVEGSFLLKGQLLRSTLAEEE